MKRLLDAALVVTFAVAAAGCGDSPQEKALEKVIEKQTGGKTEVDLSQQQVRVKTKEGELTITAGGGAEIPEGFPSDVYVYEGATVTNSMRAQGNYMIGLRIDADARTVSGEYARRMTEQGWEEEAKIDMGKRGVSLVYKKADRTASIMVAPDDAGSSMVTVSVAKN